MLINNTSSLESKLKFLTILMSLPDNSPVYTKHIQNTDSQVLAVNFFGVSINSMVHIK